MKVIHRISVILKILIYSSSVTYRRWRPNLEETSFDKPPWFGTTPYHQCPISGAVDPLRHIDSNPACLWLLREMISYLLLISRQGKVRLAKWFITLPPKSKAKIVKEVTQLVLARRAKMCNVLEYRDAKVIYRRYASLFFVCGISSEDNELITLEIIHRYVEILDRYFGNVCELDLIFNFDQAYAILDELILGGELQESSKKVVMSVIAASDFHVVEETLDSTLNAAGLVHQLQRAEIEDNVLGAKSIFEPIRTS
ncbi:adaptor complexes small subunit family protein [Pleurotus pulmonarius]